MILDGRLLVVLEGSVCVCVMEVQGSVCLSGCERGLGGWVGGWLWDWVGGCAGWDDWRGGWCDWDGD